MITLKSLIRGTAKESVRLAAIGTVSVVKFTAHKAVSVSHWANTKTNRALRPFTRWYVGTVAGTYGVHFPQEAIDETMGLAEDMVDDMYYIVHAVIDGKALDKAWDAGVARWSQYMNDAVPLLMDAKFAA